MKNRAHKGQRLASRLVLAGLMALPLLSACGLRGGLARPDPIFNNVPPLEEIKDDVEKAPAESTITRQRVNEFGGEIPDAAPTEPVVTAPLGDPVPPVDDEDDE